MKTELQKGVYCLSQAGKLYTAADWDKTQQPQGVVVVPDDSGEHAFIVAPHNTIRAQFGPRMACRGLITDKESWDALEATRRIVDNFKGECHVDPYGDTAFDFIGAPAAEFCLNYEHGRIGRGEWALPTVMQLQAIAAVKREVNAAFLAMGCPTLTMDVYWSSIAHERESWGAWDVCMSYGYASGSIRRYCGSVRAVSAFRNLD